MNRCANCKGNVHTPDNRTGLIHTNNKYACQDDKGKRLETVAE